MKKYTAQEIYELISDKLNFITTDTRSLSQGSIFLTLKGDRFNGNDFIKDAFDKGADLIIADEYLDEDKRVLNVADAYKTLCELGLIHRLMLNTKIIALTGTNGKTTTKELLYHIFKTKYNTLATKGNLNNHIGVPLTLLSLKPEIEFLILEMGANKLGDIKELCELSHPDEGLITNIGKAHLEGFGSQMGILQTKTELFDFINKRSGPIYFNTNSGFLNLKRESYSNLITYGEQKDLCDFRFTLMQEFPTIKLTLEYKSQSHNFNSNLFGSHNFENIMAAITVALNHDIDYEQIQAGILNYVPSNMRSQITQWNGAIIILDAYNANPSSMDIAIKSLIAFDGQRKWAILGEMAELGNDSVTEHNSLVKYIEASNIEQIILIGKQFLHSNYTRSVYFDNVMACKEWMNEQDIKNVTILIKGSRSVGLEKLMTDQLH